MFFLFHKRPAATFLKQHSKDCVGCTGMFLSTKQKHATKILMAQKNQYAYLNSPYVDKFGCTDHGKFIFFFNVILLFFFHEVRSHLSKVGKQ